MVKAKYETSNGLERCVRTVWIQRSSVPVLSVSSGGFSCAVHILFCQSPYNYTHCTYMLAGRGGAPTADDPQHDSHPDGCAGHHESLCSRAQEGQSCSEFSQLNV